jgi:hypothetical protein
VGRKLADEAAGEHLAVVVGIWDEHPEIVA